MARNRKSVMGISVPAPRITGRAVRLVALQLALPLIAALIAFDILVWLIADAIWGICIGLWCWF